MSNLLNLASFKNSSRIEPPVSFLTDLAAATQMKNAYAIKLKMFQISLFIPTYLENTSQLILTKQCKTALRKMLPN